jgi:tRNA pseudouridine55 synthase
MDGLLVIDKPAGPTSHDVVARMRRVLRERRIGHTGTLDPAATGVLPLVIGRATRLARFLSAGDKSYLATIRLGVRTDTADATGQPIGERYTGPMPSRRSVDAALDAFRGMFVQQPPAFSAKRIAGTRSYRLARAAARRQGGKSGRAPESALPAPVMVNADTLNLIAMEGDTLALELRCSAGFYVRSLARDLGEQLGTGAHLAALRRTRSGDAGLDQAIGLDEAERAPARAAAAVIPLGRLLPHLPSIVLTEEGVIDTVHGRMLRGGTLCSANPGSSDVGALAQHLRSGESGFVRLFGPTGELVGIAVPGEAPGSLRPAVVLV